MDNAVYVYRLARGSYFQPEEYRIFSLEEGETFDNERLGLDLDEERCLFCAPHTPWDVFPSVDYEQEEVLR